MLSRVQLVQGCGASADLRLRIDFAVLLGRSEQLGREKQPWCCSGVSSMAWSSWSCIFRWFGFVSVVFCNDVVVISNRNDHYVGGDDDDDDDDDDVDVVVGLCESWSTQLLCNLLWFYSQVCSWHMLSLRTLTQKERDVLLEGAQKTWLGKARYPFF